MAVTKLFGSRIQPACKYCEVAMRYIQGEEMVLCEKRGIVVPEFHCKFFRYDPLKREPKQRVAKEEHKESEFSV